MDYPWTEITSNAYGLAITMIAMIIPIMIILFAIRLIGKSAKKTIRSIKK